MSVRFAIHVYFWIYSLFLLSMSVILVFSCTEEVSVSQAVCQNCPYHNYCPCHECPFHNTSVFLDIFTKVFAFHFPMSVILVFLYTEEVSASQAVFQLSVTIVRHNCPFHKCNQNGLGGQMIGQI